ncbi:hypothetical protein [Alkalihalobacterium elongatum]|uniref:hypothetical protein n=1 Tax=Alkalihalobacterium elongatum TaxID=2675466 RepID=UPI001F2474AC|nr:hypothetical protein [Alkalihalobacterium elongatum]
MKQPKIRAYGTFTKRNGNIYRKSAYIQWGDSDKSLGACLLQNPGSATLNEKLSSLLNTEETVTGQIKTEDPTMGQLIQFVESITTKDNLEGRLHIYNLFNLRGTNNIKSIEKFEELCASGDYETCESLVPIEELKEHPWILLGWGVEYRAYWKNLKLIKKRWLNLIENSGVISFGKRHKKREDYYHPCPLIPTNRPTILKQLITIYKESTNTYKKIQRFPVYATKPNLIVDDNNEMEVEYEQNFGWSKSIGNPEMVILGFSQLRIKEGYKLRAYQYTEGGNGNGIVWAIPSEKELPDPRECEILEDFFLSPPKPEFALSDFMAVIDGDKSPLSYLQASIVYHELHEYGAMWHGVSWGRDMILPHNNILSEYEWEMEEEEPKIIEPHFYYNTEGNPVVIFHTINDIGVVTFNRYEHIFSKGDYTLSVNKKCIATADGGIIF